ncbi:MAG: DUF4271 domain-containing protein [Flavobacteriaceae bacterium]|nr:DUF4271 domain-containing protein [Flavobacteriaceae bacterium]
MIVLVLITLLKNNYNQQFTKLFSLFYSEKYYTDYVKMNPLLFNRFHFLFFFVIAFNYSLFVFFGFKTFYSQIIINDFYFYFQILNLTILFILIRYFIGFLLSVIFELSNDQRYLTFLKISNLSYLSLIVFPLIVVIAYSVGFFQKFLLIIGLILFVILSLFNYIKLIKNEKLNFSNLFYLFLYLCALEIAPFIVIYKLFIY